MALKDFALLTKLEELDVYTHKIVKSFERSERHVLSAEIRQTLSDILHLVIRASKEQLEERRLRSPLVRTKELLRQCDVELEYLQSQIRKAYALRLINEKRYGHWSQQVREVGAMLGAWIKNIDKTVPKNTTQKKAIPPQQVGLL